MAILNKLSVAIEFHSDPHIFSFYKADCFEDSGGKNSELFLWIF